MVGQGGSAGAGHRRKFMVIQHNISAIDSYRNYQGNATKLSKNLEKLSSGYRIKKAGDDAAGLAISEQMRNKINGLDQAESNAKDAVGLIQTAEGALTEVHSMLERMTTLATQAANGTYNSVARGNIQQEIDELNEEINRIGSATDYNGVKLLNQTADGSTVNTFQIGPTAQETLVLKGTKIATSTLGGSSLKISGIKVSTVSQANSAITTLETAVNQVSTYRATLGAKQNRLEHTIANLQVTNENITSAESRIRDTDMAKEISAFTKNNVLNQAAQSMLTQANQTPQQVLSMLG